MASIKTSAAPGRAPVRDAIDDALVLRRAPKAADGLNPRRRDRFRREEAAIDAASDDANFFPRSREKARRPYRAVKARIGDNRVAARHN